MSFLVPPPASFAAPAPSDGAAVPAGAVAFGSGGGVVVGAVVAGGADVTAGGDA